MNDMTHRISPDIAEIFGLPSGEASASRVIRAIAMQLDGETCDYDHGVAPGLPEEIVFRRRVRRAVASL